MSSTSGQNAIAYAILAHMKKMFGSAFYDLLTKGIVQDYLLNKVDICNAITQYPSVFERSFIGVIGQIGEDFLVNACQKVQVDLGLDPSRRYSRIGDLAKYMCSS